MTHSKLKGESIDPLNNEFYKMVMEQTPDIILVVRSDGRIWYANESASSTYGYSIKELLTLRIQDLHGKELAETEKSKCFTANQSALVYRTTHLHSDGKEFPVEMKCRCAAFQQDAVYLISVRNITEVNELESAIQTCHYERNQLAEDWMNLFQNAPGGYHSLHLDGSFIYMNDTELKWLGYRREEVIGILCFEDILTEKSRARYQAYAAGVKEKGQIGETDLEMVRKDGSVFPVLISTLFIKDDSGHYYKSLSTCIDITERKLWEEGILASENKYRALAENSNDLIARYDGECRYLYVNPAIEPIAGMPKEAFIGKTNEELKLPRAFCIIIRQGIKGVLNKGQSIQRELEHFIDNRRMVFHLQLVPEFHTDNSIASVLCVGRDITKVRELQDEMFRNELKYTNLFEHMSEGFNYERIITNDDHSIIDSIILEANAAYCRMANRSVNDIIGKKSSEITLTSILPELSWVNLCQKVINEGPTTIECYSFPLKKWFSVIAYSPIQDHLAILYIDITKRMEAEKKLQESDKRYKELVQAAKVIIVIINSSGEIIFMNEWGLSFFGFSKDELIGQSVFDTIAPEYDSMGQDLREVFEGLKNNNGSFQRHLSENMTSSGRRVWIDWTNRVVIDPVTGEFQLSAIGFDVTATKKAEQEQLYGYERRKRRELLNDVIHRRISQEELVAGAAQLELKIKPPFVILLLATPWQSLPQNTSIEESGERQHSVDRLVDNIQRQIGGVTWQTQEGIAILYPLPVKELRVSLKQTKVVAEAVTEQLTRFWQGMQIRGGISHSSEATFLIADVYDQARLSLLCSPVLYPENLLHYWEELGCYQFIFNDCSSQQARQFINYHLGALLNPEGKGDQSELLATLKEVITGASAQTIGKRLFVHPQTVVFRKRNLEKMMGVDLDSLQVRMDVSVALKLLSLLETTSSGSEQ
ncbi:PAS domain S-box protein [Pelosinus propionicus]|uniref:PAS domain S-box-containing protein n=1 Tax=Pelosinus propionicus DSM 13327 TaxID=1123291 RepID=A0A1I4KB58_9FIRM|nr:PAS domain S-box protein [Pelosinus propionicus]SFL75813.1 PAS domain S-box-containing protein [Pelosinus propionicus DSM 13327]